LLEFPDLISAIVQHAANLEIVIKVNIITGTKTPSSSNIPQVTPVETNVRWSAHVPYFQLIQPENSNVVAFGMIATLSDSHFI